MHAEPDVLNPGKLFFFKHSWNLHFADFARCAVQFEDDVDSNQFCVTMCTQHNPTQQCVHNTAD